MKCFGGGFRRESLEDEVACLRHSLEREAFKRQAMQQQLIQEQAKCALLEQEIQQAAQAAHEMGESLRQYFSQAGSDSSEQRGPWGTPTTGTPGRPFAPSEACDMQQFSPAAPRSSMHSSDILPSRRFVDTNQYDQSSAAGSITQQSSKHSVGHAPEDQIQAYHMRQQLQHQHQQYQQPASISSKASSQLRSSSHLSSTDAASPLLSCQPTTGRGTARMHRHMLQVADQLKGLALSWQQRLDDYQPLHAGIAAAGASGAADAGGYTPGRDQPAAAAAPPTSSPAAAGAHARASAAAPGTASRLSRSSAAAAAGAAATSAGATAGDLRQADSSLAAMQQAPFHSSSSSDSVPDPPLCNPHQPGCLSASEEWGSHSSYTDNANSSTAALSHDHNDLSSSISSFPRYRSSMQHAVAVAENIEEECEEDEEEEESEQEVGVNESEEVGGEEVQWRSQQLQHQQQCEQHSLHSLLQRQQHLKQQQQQQQQMVSPDAWGQPSSAVVPGCAITRGAAAPLKTGTPLAGGGSSSSIKAPSPAAAGVAVVAVDAGRTPTRPPLTVGATMLPSAHHAQQQAHGHHYQQQQRRAFAPPAEHYNNQAGQQAQHWQQQQHRVGRQAGVDVVPQDLKFMAPLRRHQVYLGGSQHSFKSSLAAPSDYSSE